MPVGFIRSWGGMPTQACNNKVFLPPSNPNRPLSPPGLSHTRMDSPGAGHILPSHLPLDSTLLLALRL